MYFPLINIFAVHWTAARLTVVYSNTLYFVGVDIIEPMILEMEPEPIDVFGVTF